MDWPCAAGAADAPCAAGGVDALDVAGGVEALCGAGAAGLLARAASGGGVVAHPQAITKIVTATSAPRELRPGARGVGIMANALKATRIPPEASPSTNRRRPHRYLSLLRAGMTSCPYGQWKWPAVAISVLRLLREQSPVPPRRKSNTRCWFFSLDDHGAYGSDTQRNRGWWRIAPARTVIPSVSHPPQLPVALPTPRVDVPIGVRIYRHALLEKFSWPLPARQLCCSRRTLPNFHSSFS